MSGEHPDPVPGTVTDNWDDLLADAETRAETYREDGWDVLLIHTGDVTPLFDEPFGLDVLAPGSDFEDLQELADSVTFDTSRVYRAETDSARFLVIALEASDAEQAVVVPAFISLEDATRLEEQASEDDVMYTHVRPLSDDTRVTFTHDDPSLFF